MSALSDLQEMVVIESFLAVRFTTWAVGILFVFLFGGSFVPSSVGKSVPITAE